MRVYLTGATGLLGRHVAAHLAASGRDVVALHRRGADTRELARLGCTLMEGDVRDEAERLAPGMEGCTHLVHGAAQVYSGGVWPKIRATNVDGTRNVLTAAHRAGIQQALHISSVAVYGTSDGSVTEASPIDGALPPSDLYARSKREAEEVARGIEERRGLPVVVVRPSAVYGEGDRLMAPALANMLRLPLVPLLGPGTNPLPVVYAGNVATAIVRALEAGGSGTFNVGLDHPINQRDLFAWLAEGMGIRARFLTLPAPLVRTGATALARIGFSTPGAPHLPLQRVVRLALGENPYPSHRIREELGWAPTYTHREALERTGRWLAWVLRAGRNS